MSDINHQVGIKATPERIYELLTTDKGLSQRWTNDISGAGVVGSIIKFRFNGGGPIFQYRNLFQIKLFLGNT